MRLINADALYETLCHIWDRTDSEDFEKAVFREIENAPVVEERKTGKWIRNRGLTPWPICSECGTYGANESNYCSYCGAKMEERC